MLDSLFDHADRYPHAPAKGKTATSEDAAEIIQPRHGILQAMVLRCMSDYGHLTWKEVSSITGEDSRNIQPRFSELKELGLIVGTGQRREKCEVYRRVENE